MSLLRNILLNSQPVLPRHLASAQEYRERGADMLQKVFDQETTAHIAVDLQRGYCEPCLPVYYLKNDANHFFTLARDTIKEIVTLSDEFNIAGIGQFWLRHKEEMPHDHVSEQIKVYDRIRHAPMIAEYIARAGEMIVPADPARVVDKRKRSGFYMTDLADRLRAENRKTVLITGGGRNECVLETAQGAVNHGFTTFVIDDLTLAHGDYFTPFRQAQYCKMLSDSGVHTVAVAQVRKIMGYTF